MALGPLQWAVLATRGAGHLFRAPPPPPPSEGCSSGWPPSPIPHALVIQRERPRPALAPDCRCLMLLNKSWSGPIKHLPQRSALCHPDAISPQEARWHLRDPSSTDGEQGPGSTWSDLCFPSWNQPLRRATRSPAACCSALAAPCSDLQAPHHVEGGLPHHQPLLLTPLSNLC